MAFLVSTACAYTDGHSENASSDDEAAANNWGTACALVAFLMALDICASPSAAFLRHILQDSSAYQHVDDVRRATPSVSWHIQCYHYHTEHYQTSRTDSSTGRSKHTRNPSVRVRRSYHER